MSRDRNGFYCEDNNNNNHKTQRTTRRALKVVIFIKWYNFDKRPWKTLNQWYLFKLPASYIESSLDRLGLLSPTHDQRSQQQSGQIAPQSVLINKSKFLKATHRTKLRKIEIPRSMVVEALSWWNRRASQYPAVQSPVHSWKSPTNLARSPLFVALVGRKMTVVRHQFFPQKPPGSRFWFSRTGVQPPPWLVDDRAALQHRRIWCVPTR